MKAYTRHNCQSRHTTWPDLAACVWPHARIVGDGQYAAVSCGAHVVTLFATASQARARKYDFDRDGCRDRCYQRHKVVALDPNAQPTEPRKPTSPVTRLATTLAAPPPPKPERPICGQPRTNGEPCRRPQGWGADPGQEHCRDHGGSTVQRQAEAERLVEQALVFARLAEKARTEPLTVEEQARAETAARDVLMARQGRRGSSPKGLSGWPFRSPFPEVSGLAHQSLGLLVAEVVRRLGGEVL